MQRLLLRLLILLLLFPPPSQTRAHAPLTRQQQPPPDINNRQFVIILIDGQTFHNFELHFQLQSPVPSHIPNPQLPQFYNENFTVIDSPNIISSSNFSYFPASEIGAFLIVSCSFTFHALPGRALTQLTLTEPNSAVQYRAEFLFHVVGVVLYSIQPPDRLLIHSGRASSPIQLPDPDRGLQVRTVNAAVYAGPPSFEVQSPNDLQPQDMRLSPTTPITTDPSAPSSPAVDASDLLPWNPDDCSVFLNASQLDHRCAMAFSPAFDQFTIRVPTPTGLQQQVRVDFRWRGLQDFYDAANLADGIEAGLAGSGPMQSLADNRVSFAIVIDAGNARARQVGAGLEAWKVAVVVVVLVLVLIATVVLVCCYCGCGKWEESSEKSGPILTGLASKLGWWPSRLRLRRHHSRSDELSKCYVQEPSSMGNLTVLMLGNSERSLRLDGEVAETSREGDGGSGAERLVLAGMVRRGIDLEPSTEGGSSRFPLSEEGLSFGRGTWTEEDGFEHATGEAQGELVDKRERISDYDDDSRMTGAETTIDRSGVGAAINRVRQLDMLKGPVSKGLLGDGAKSGSAGPEHNEGSGGQRPAWPLSASTVS